MISSELRPRYRPASAAPPCDRLFARAAPRWTLGGVAAVLLSLGGRATAQAVNLIDLAHGPGTGSFESGGYVQTGPGFMRLGTGSTAITGWTVGGASGVDWLAAPQHAGASGLRSLDLKGTFAGSFGEIATSIPTCVGCTYQLEFRCYAGNVANTGTVAAGSLQGHTFGGPVTTNPAVAVYGFVSVSFVAQAPTTVVTFRSATSDGFGPVVDDVVVTPLAGLITSTPHGCGGLGFTLTGPAVLGSTLTATMVGGVGVPLLGIGLTATSVPFCGCTIGHDWIVSTVGSSVQLAVPPSTAWIGIGIGFQGADLFGASSCAVLPVALTDTFFATIG